MCFNMTIHFFFLSWCRFDIDIALLILRGIYFYRYELASNMDTQLKQMSEDLKEIIENLNERNRAQDSTDPVSYFSPYLCYHL